MIFGLRGVLEEFREIPSVKLRGGCRGIICLSSSHARTHARTHRLLLELHAMTVLELLFKSSYFDKVRHCSP